MDADVLVEAILALTIIGIPAAALAARFVLRPMLKDIVEAIQSVKQPASPELERRLTDIEESHQLIEQQLNQLIEAERFRRELGSGKDQ